MIYLGDETLTLDNEAESPSICATCPTPIIVCNAFTADSSHPTRAYYLSPAFENEP